MYSRRYKIFLFIFWEGPTPVSALIHAATMVTNTEIKTNNNNNNSNANNILNPYFITGYTDGDGSFSVKFRKTGEDKFSITPVYSIGAEVNIPNRELLDKVKYFFKNKGSISRSGNMYYYEITGLISLKLVIDHFNKFPLETSKSINFQLWSEILDLLEKKVHKTDQGLKKIISIKALFPRGLPKAVLKEYSVINELRGKKKPEFIPKTCLLDLNWIAGFVQADGTFGLHYVKSVRSKLGFVCEPQFRICQHERDLVVLKRIISSLGCGTLVKPFLDRNRYDLWVASLYNLKTIIVPLFTHHPLYGAKQLDFKCFSEGISIIEKKGHLSEHGLNKLKDLAYSINTSRKF